MTSNEILKADVLDIVFENRNKKYGAYLLRKYYNNRLTIGLAGMLGLVLIVILIILLNPGMRQAISNIVNPDKATVVVLPPPPEPPPIIQPQMHNTRSENFVNRIEIVEDVTDVPDHTLLEQAAISDHVQDGDPADASQSSGLNQGTVVQEIVEEIVPPPSLPTTAASFPGGQQAWMAFLNRYLRTPGELEAGQKKTVLVRFSVGSDGSISQFEIMQSGGEAFDNEVIRVLKRMPKWKPAVQNGHNITAMFTQPVTFMAYEE